MGAGNEFAPQLGPGKPMSISNAYYVKNPAPGLSANRFLDSVRNDQKMAFPDTTLFFGIHFWDTAPRSLSGFFTPKCKLGIN